MWKPCFVKFGHKCISVVVIEVLTSPWQQLFTVLVIEHEVHCLRNAVTVQPVWVIIPVPLTSKLLLGVNIPLTWCYIHTHFTCMYLCN